MNCKTTYSFRPKKRFHHETVYNLHRDNSFAYFKFSEMLCFNMQIRHCLSNMHINVFFPQHQHLFKHVSQWEEIVRGHLSFFFFFFFSQVVTLSTSSWKSQCCSCQRSSFSGNQTRVRWDGTCHPGNQEDGTTWIRIFQNRGRKKPVRGSRSAVRAINLRVVNVLLTLQSALWYHS